MKKIGLLLIGALAVFVLFSSIVPILAFAVSVIVLYLVFKEFMKTDSPVWRIVLGITGILLLISAAANIPAILGLVAIYVLYLVYKKWKDMKAASDYDDQDPFKNFERQWREFDKF